MMGSASSIASPTSDDVHIVWQKEVWEKAKAIWEGAERNIKRTQHSQKKLVIKRKGWRTIRIFVSSTFKDFHNEREVLVKKVFPDLRAWCEVRKLYLVECDLRWGVPKDFTTEATLKACFGEIDRCYHDNIMPFFLNMTSERVGWVPLGSEVPDVIRKEYEWIEGMSVTEMEIMHGAYTIDNPNALFMVRDSSFIKDLPKECKKNYVEDEPFASAKMQVLKEKIKKRFPDRTIHYKVQVLDCNPRAKMVRLGGLEKAFSEKVYEFFRKRIEHQYPLDEEELDSFLQTKERHEAFLKNRCENVIGRQDMIEQINNYVCSKDSDVPLLIVGDTGSGKSSLLAKIADVAVYKASNGLLPGGDQRCWHVFYHFVGAVPGSTELLPMLQRLLKELNAITDLSMPSDLDLASQLTCSALANPNTPPCIVVVDALNQFDDDTASQAVSWVPKKLAPNIRCIFSMIDDTVQHKSLICRELQPLEIYVIPLTENDRRAIVMSFLDRYNKKLDENQMKLLLSKKSSENPLWLSIACEELRVFGLFHQLSDKINSLPDGLLELEEMVLSRFEAENGGDLLIATLSLLEVSARGLLEIELQIILGDEKDLMPPKMNRQSGKREYSKGYSERLPAYKWAEIYRGLRTFLRPFGDSGEGRLDFYHRSLSKTVRKKYFEGTEKELKYRWWHSKLADYFEKRSTNVHRKIEELPTHLIAIEARERLERFLTDWNVFDLLFDEEYSMKLLAYWRKGSSLDNMEKCYICALEHLETQKGITKECLCIRYEHIARLFLQGGLFEVAKELSVKAQEMEDKELGARPERMADLYFLKAQLQDEIMKTEEYMYKSHLPKIRVIIEDFEKAIGIYKRLSGDEMQRKLGRIYNRVSFYYTGYDKRGGDEYLSAEEASRRAKESIDMAIEIFEKLNDELNVADCLVTKAICFESYSPEKIKYLKQAEELALRITGGLHHNLDRMYLNMAIHYEECKDFYAAYDYFYKWHILCVDLYGRTHPRTKRTYTTLQEPLYQRIACEKGNQIPEI